MNAFDGPVGPLEALFRESEVPRRPELPVAAIVCHPHPAHGGTMHNKVVYTLSKALLASGIATLRFNFRGVGKSAGVYDEGKGEREDIRAGINWLAGRYPDAPLMLAGFSFGAWHGSSVAARDSRITRLVLAGLPVGTYSRPPFDPAKPALLLHGENDGFGTPEQVISAISGWSAPTELVCFRGTDHFFGGLDSARSTGRLPDVEAAIIQHLADPPAINTVRWC